MQDHEGHTEHPVSKLRGGGDVLGKLQKQEPGGGGLFNFSRPFFPTLFFKATIGNTLFRFWGWNNEVNVFDSHSATWSLPETQVRDA